LDASDEVPARRAVTPRQPSASGTVVFVVDGPIVRADIPGLCDRVRALLDCDRVELVICDVATVTTPDGVTLDALARLQLAARRRGGRVALRHACVDLLGLLTVAGLSDIVPLEEIAPLEE
jgi:ABC-type transporter Mla MlaB component